MVWIIYISLVITGLLFAGFFVTMLIATIYDVWYAHKNKMWIALQRDHSKPKRPAAK